MAALVNLPNELLNLILLALLHDDPDLETITSLSLVNRQLRSIAHPVAQQYLCLEGDFGSYRPPKSPDPREEAFLHIFSDDARAAAVRYLKVTGHVEKTGIELLARLRNVTHLEVSGAWADREDDGDSFHMVHSLVGSFPALRTLYLKDCYQEDEDFDEFQDELQDDPTEYTGRNAYEPDGIISNSLNHLICENVDPAFRKLWLSTPEIEVVEMHMCEFKPWDDAFREIGAHRMLLRDPDFCGKVKRFHVEHRLVDEVDDDDTVDDYDQELEWLLHYARDAGNIQSFFQWRAHVLPCLQELILEVPFYLEHIPDILAALPEICPNLKVFKFEMSRRGHDDFIDHGQNSLLPPAKEFGSLEELRLPFTGLNYDLLTALPCFFLNSPRLAHVYLSNPRILDGQEPSQQALLARAEGYATAVPTLRSISWDRIATIEIGTATDMQYQVRAFRKPWWEERRGFTGWWQQTS
ncbi:hypothetical protein C8R45DRAFT_1092232 [Mycena sanguinolenta]|nr:hypothetical protein C8R45DRAFT_1092232 [Mycena sanguinolenta]